METGVRNTSGLIEDFTKLAHDAVDVLRERAVALEGNMEQVMDESNKVLGAKFEGTKLGKFIENNPSKAALYSFMTALMFTHFMKAKGINVSYGTLGVTETGETSTPKSTKAKAA
ncbi:MAG: hypothetical protein E4H19_11475 [Chromatiales bacterium]|jgi:hypothetical protein|nr:MAG: hypothetical protein E4H19_11475 [Chromatiales bacterium]